MASLPSSHSVPDLPPCQVVSLLSHPSYIPAVAQLLFDEWATLYQLEHIHSAQQLAHTLASRTPSTLPLTLIALPSSPPPPPLPLPPPSSLPPSPAVPHPSHLYPPLLGTVSLDTTDVPRTCPYSGVTPWLSSLLVVAEARGRGVGRALSVAVDEAAQARGLQWTWLWTVRSARLYETWGWRVVEWWHFAEKGKAIAIMRKDYAAQPQPQLPPSSSTAGRLPSPSSLTAAAQGHPHAEPAQ